MNPTPAAIAAIDIFVAGLAGGWASNTDAQVVTAANNPTVANPAAQGQIPAGYSAASLLGLLSQSSAQNVESFPGIAQLFADIVSQNTPSVLAAVSLMLASGRILSSEASAIGTAVVAIQPDPAYQSHVGWAQANLGRPLDLYDSATARAAQ